MSEFLTDENIRLLTGTIALAIAVWPFIANFLTDHQRRRIERVATTAVKYAEMYARNRPDADKFSIALNEAMRMGKRHRAKLRTDEWFPYLEEAVHDLKKSGGELPKQVDRDLPRGSISINNDFSLR